MPTEREPPAGRLRVEFVATGDEIVSGQIRDTNGPWLMDRLFTLGETVARSTAVPDDLPEIVAALQEAAARSDVVVVSGGLGPTLDDLTVDAACAAFGRDPLVDPAHLEHIRARFERAGRAFTANNERQARVPAGAEALGNDHGTALSFRLHAGACELTFVPGVPREFTALLEQHLLPRLEARLRRDGVFRCFRAVRCWDVAESHMDALVRPLLAAHPHVRYGTRTSFPENQVKLLAEGSTEEEARERAEALEREVRGALGASAFGAHDTTFAAATLEALERRGWKVALAESLTAGAAAALLADAPGASRVLLGSSVTYASELKERWLSVPARVLAEHGAVSEACAMAMATGVLERSGADVAAALTGVAGPGPDASGVPAGTVIAAIAGRGPTLALRRTFLRPRAEVRRAAAYLALDLLRRRALGIEAG